MNIQTFFQSIEQEPVLNAASASLTEKEKSDFSFQLQQQLSFVKEEGKQENTEDELLKISETEELEEEEFILPMSILQPLFYSIEAEQEIGNHMTVEAPVSDESVEWISLRKSQNVIESEIVSQEVELGQEFLHEMSKDTESSLIEVVKETEKVVFKEAESLEIQLEKAVDSLKLKSDSLDILPLLNQLTASQKKLLSESLDIGTEEGLSKEKIEQLNIMKASEISKPLEETIVKTVTTGSNVEGVSVENTNLKVSPKPEAKPEVALLKNDTKAELDSNKVKDQTNDNNALQVPEMKHFTVEQLADTKTPTVKLDKEEALAFIEQLATETINGGENKFVRTTVQLTPETLGKMEIQLDVSKDKIIGRLIVSSEETKNWIENQLKDSTLAKAVQPINVERLEIQVVKQPDKAQQDPSTFLSYSNGQGNQQQEGKKKRPASVSYENNEEYSAVTYSSLTQNTDNGRISLLV